jgi:hypothetical protein
METKNLKLRTTNTHYSTIHLLEISTTLYELSVQNVGCMKGEPVRVTKDELRALFLMLAEVLVKGDAGAN